MRRPTTWRDRAILLLLLDTGIRAGELGRLQISDVNLDTGEVRVRPHGSGHKTKARTLYIEKITRAAVWKYLTTRDKDGDRPLFITENGHPFNRSSLYHLVESLGDRCGIVANVHRFRHTFAVQYLRNGGDIFTLQRLLGHSSLNMVRTYLSLADADAAKAHRNASPVQHWFN